ncbi:DEBR0S1_14598g1_1 [Brettanomyces bruxellensis]|uniref:DEBR0S1_14598g1_1 n=1 Tax=Dekkera bruxellensis TaxID=5007 RepID=A0A7D9CWG5_DEKBR|nr:DEBR0S1_14598g1_1 [Brettanomyces bruxellensis]
MSEQNTKQESQSPKEEITQPVPRPISDDDGLGLRARKLANRSSLLLGMSSSISTEEELESEDKDTQKLADSGKSISNKSSDQEAAPKLVQIPKLPPRTPNQATDAQFDTPRNYGLDRVAGEAFELGSPSKDQPADTFSDDNYGDEQPVIEKVLSSLLRERASEVDDVIHSIPEKLRVSGEECLKKLHSSDELIEILSEVESGNFTNPDRETVFSLILGGFKIADEVENADITGLNVDLFKNTIKSLSLTKEFNEDQMVEDMMKICSISGEESPNPLVCYIHTEIHSIKTCLVLELLMSRFVTSNSEFEFLLLRSLETRNPQLIVKKYNSGELSLVKLKDLISSGNIWLDLITKVESSGMGPELVKNSVVYGFKSLIDPLVTCIISPEDEKLTDLAVQSDLCKYHREYSIIKENSDAFSTDNTIVKERQTLKFFREDLKKKKQSYTDLLNNYKQLNEERFSNDSTLKKLKMENEELRKRLDDGKKELGSKLSDFEVIKINNDKNEEINKMNENLRHEIARVSSEIGELSLKLKK